MNNNSNVRKCDNPGCRKQKQTVVNIEVPEEITVVLEEEAKKYGMSYEQLVLMILEDYIVGRERLRESIETMVKKACEEEFNRIAFPILCALEGKKKKNKN